MSEPLSPRPDDRYAPSEATRRVWARRGRGRLVIVAALVILVFARVLSAGAFAWWPVLVGLGVIVAGLVGIKALARYRLAHLPPGAVWAGSAAVDVADLRASGLLRQAGPRAGFWTAFLFSYDLVPGLLVIEEAGLRWRPGLLARWCGASSWTLESRELAAAELGRQRSLPGPVGLWLRLLLADRSAVSMQLTSRAGLEAALDRLGLRQRRVWPF